MTNQYNNQEDQLLVNMPTEVKEDWRSRRDSMAGAARQMMIAWMEYEDEHGLKEDFDDIELILLKTYLNAVEKNISQLEAQRDKLEDEIERIEEEENKEVLLEIDIEMEGIGL